MNERVSIITPSFNQAPFLQRHLDSVAGQGPSVIEHIIMDGGSTDGSVELLRGAGPLVHWVSEPDGGQTSALRKALLRATGDVIGWLNVDEFYEPQAVRLALETFGRRPAAVAVYGDFRRISASGAQIRVNRQWKYDRNIGRIVTPIIQNCAGFFRRERLLEINAFAREDLQYVMDWDLYIELMKDGGEAVYVPHLLGNFTMHALSKTSQAQDGFEREIRQLQRRQFPGASDRRIALLHRYHHARMALHMARTGILWDKMRFKLFEQLKFEQEYGSPGVTWFHRFM
jgi:glycosyltransferase involved in cell wall biosynthesis